MPAIGALAAVITPFFGAASTIVAGALVGAATGALVSAVTGGDILKGALLGAIGGGIGGAVASASAAAAPANAFMGGAEYMVPAGPVSSGTGAVVASAPTPGDLGARAAPTSTPTPPAATRSIFDLSGDTLSNKQRLLLETAKGGLDMLSKRGPTESQTRAEHDKWQASQGPPRVTPPVGTVSMSGRSQYNAEIDRLLAALNPTVQAPVVERPAVARETGALA
jgi:hypothetical protein